jgi:hypothetical protein
MKRPVRKASALRLFGGMAAIGVAASALSGCEQPGAAVPVAPTETASAAAPSASIPDAVIADTDPDAFDLTESTYWDGRPSLGGLWVAHPLADKPMRARIINEDTGASADGALFRRDAALPGPPIMLSYDAARAIGVKAGIVTQIRIVALKDEATLAAERKAATPEAASTSAEASVETVALPPAEDAAPQPAAKAVAAPAAPAPATETPAPQIAASEAAAPATAAEAAAGEELAKKPIPSPDPSAEVPPKSPPESPPLATAAPADGEKSEFATAVKAALSEDPAKVAAASEEAPPAQTPPAPALKNRLIQIATFQLAVNAEKTATSFREDGVPAEVRQGLASGERRMSRVLLGPFDDAEAQSAAMSAARKRGFKDAYYVDN